MLDHMVERSGLRRSTGEQSKSMKGNQYYRILQIGKEKRDARLAIVTDMDILVRYIQRDPIEKT